MKTNPNKRNDLPFQHPLLERLWNAGTFRRSSAERFGTIFGKFMKINDKKRNDKISVLERGTTRSAPPVS